jgi:cell division septum initiation protein DivIVA
MNPTAILALIGDLYVQIAQLQETNRELQARVAELESESASSGEPNNA